MPAYSDSSCLITAAGLHVSGSGKMLSLLASHGEVAAETISFYDGMDASGTKLLQVVIPAGVAPVLLEFKPYSINFTIGLYVDPGACKLFLERVAP